MLKGNKEIYGFGPYTLDVSEHRLEREDGGEVAYLPEKAFRTLVVLVRNAGSLVTKEQLLAEVWPDTIVEENNLDKCIYTIRQSLGDTPSQHQFIETVRKHGYRFIADVRGIRLPDNDAVQADADEPGRVDDAGILGVSKSAPVTAREVRFRNAYEICQQARFKYEQMTAPTTLEARELVDEALRIDPDLHLAHSLSAELTTLEVIVGLKWPEEGFAEARASVARARKLGADTPDFYSSSAYVDLIADWDFATAEEKLRRALAVNEHHGPANRMLTEVLMFQGRHDEAARYVKRAQVETGLHNANILAISRFLARDYSGVLKVCDEMLVLSPGHIIPSWTKCWAFEQMGRADEAIAGYQSIMKLPYGEPALRWIGYAYAVAGDRANALETAARLAAASQKHNLSPTHIAAIYSGLGEIDTALVYLEKGLEMHDPFMLWVPADPRYDNLRQNQRFDEIVGSVLAKGRQRSYSEPARITGKRSPIDMALPVSGITESGQHLLLDITDLHKLAKQMDGRNKRRETADLKPIPTNRPVEGAGRRVRWIPIVGLLLILVASAFIGAKLWRTEKGSPALSASQRRLTVEGGVTRAAISRDGRYAVAAQNAALVLFDLESSGSRVLLPAAKDVRIMSITFSPNGGELYFGTRTNDQSIVTIYSLPLSGGNPVKIVDNIYGAPTFSPDGKKIAFVRRYDELNQYALLTANADGSNANELVSSRLPERFDAPPAWSPDGRTIACSRVSLEGGFHFTIAKIDASSGAVTVVPNQRWKSLGAISWLSDSRNVIIAGQDENSVNAQVWQADTETGATNRITNDQFVYESLNTSYDGSSIVAVKVRQNSHVWMMGDQAVQLTAGSDNYDGFNGLAWAKDGTILYHSRAMGREAIWRMKQDGTEALEITPDAASGFALSPDGRLLVFQKKQASGHLGLQVIDLETRAERPLTREITALSPSFFPDGKTIVFTKYDDKLTIHKITIGGRPPQLLNDEFRAATTPEVSPTGRLVAFAFNKVESGNLQSGIAVIDAETRQLVSSHITKIVLASPYEKSRIQWSADESEVYFIQLENSVSNIMRLRLSDGIVSNLTNFTEGRIFNFAIEPGGRRVLAARGFVERDAFLLKPDRNN